MKPPHKDLANIHANLLRVLREIGLKVENARLLDALDGIGAEIDSSAQIARFPSPVVEELLAEARVAERPPPAVDARASIYVGKYRDPHSGELKPMDTPTAAAYFDLARALPNVTSCFVTGWPWADKPELEPLLERFHAWKLGVGASGILYPAESAEPLLDLLQAFAQLRGVPVQGVFAGGVFMQSPLRFPAEEAAQFEWWWSRGFKPGISHMTTGGLTGPVTPAGLVTVHLAEMIAIGLVYKACYGTASLDGSAMLAPVDMRTFMRPYGRPDMSVANLLFARMAEHYGISCFLHSGLTDAYLPSTEAGYQKAMSLMAALSTGSNALLEAGLLCGDRIYSPIQMILDNEFAGALRHMMRVPDCSDEAIGFDAMVEAGHEDLFTPLEHTVQHFREETWEPALWTREPLEACAELTTDEQRARDRYDELMATATHEEFLSPEEEEALLEVIGE